jgi:hypothetical protein
VSQHHVNFSDVAVVVKLRRHPEGRRALAHHAESKAQPVGTRGKRFKKRTAQRLAHKALSDTNWWIRHGD